MHYYKKNIGDYRRNTIHLSLLEHGVYSQLIDQYYLKEGVGFDKPVESIARLIGARTEDEVAVVSVILDEFFTETDSGYIHNKCDENLKDYIAQGNRSRENGKKAVKPSRNPVGNLVGTLTTNQEPLTNNHIELFEEFWEAYPHRNGKRTKKQSLVWWKKQSLDTLTNVFNNTKKYVKYLEQCKKDSIWVANPPDPIRYLNNEQYKDELDVKADVIDRLSIANILYKQDSNFHNLTKDEQSKRINNYTKENA